MGAKGRVQVEEVYQYGSSFAQTQSGDVPVGKYRRSELYSANFSRWLITCCGVLQSFASTGPLFGFTAIAVILKDEGALRESLCVNLLTVLCVHRSIF